MGHKSRCMWHVLDVLDVFFVSFGWSLICFNMCFRLGSILILDRLFGSEPLVQSRRAHQEMLMSLRAWECWCHGNYREFRTKKANLALQTHSIPKRKVVFQPTFCQVLAGQSCSIFFIYIPCIYSKLHTSQEMIEIVCTMIFFPLGVTGLFRFPKNAS